MVSRFRQYLYEEREIEIASSIGFICDRCNVTAYYFNQRNTDFNNEKTCLICSSKHFKGILLEDFVFTLSRHIPKHYNCIESHQSNSISLGEIVARFTYSNEKVIDKLVMLLCDKSPVFFKREGRYRGVVDDSIIESYKKSAIDEWHDISKEVKHTRRFTNTKAINFYERLIGDCFLMLKKMVFYSTPR
ncbi:hypothetical protein [Aeromonas veronii]|uniref:hypothetical protein n=1 Tax=Aeromonas veronii TaxID=654 RepID=UPI002B4AA653|nr:hypothetical protein [Aeromonas veronii]